MAGNEKKYFKIEFKEYVQESAEYVGNESRGEMIDALYLNCAMIIQKE